jgi:hypothetical protein
MGSTVEQSVLTEGGDEEQVPPEVVDEVEAKQQVDGRAHEDGEEGLW